MGLYAALFRYVADRAQIEEVRPAHRAYLRELLDAGTLHEAGRFAHERGGLVVYRADSEEEARALLAGDPFITEGIMELESIQEWLVILSACEESA